MPASLVERLADESGTIYDISPLINADIAVFPGDKRFERQILLSYQSGDNLCLSAIATTVHLGAHTDAPNHYHPKGVGIDERPLSYYLGPCQVIAISGQPETIKPEDLADMPLQAKRVLFKTGSFPNPQTWRDDFTALSPELVEHLARQGVKLVGIDTPSIDPASSKELPSHGAVYRHDMAILEGIVLAHVPAGLYQLIALPLKIQGADASPVRAILVG